MARARRAALTALLCAALLPRAAGALQTIAPLLPGKNNVRWWEFDWKHVDLVPLPGAAPVRLYFYDSERQVARVAAAFIAEAYTDLAAVFGYRPTATVPLLLYNSHFEFQSTQAFFVSEHVLGVTSPEELTMALPYWGDTARFVHVLRHELAHQFTIQLVIDAGKAARACNPLGLMPLWFMEGAAEHFSQAELTPEVRAALADLLLRLQGKFPGFFDEGPGTFERVYLVGHAQVRFLEERYGRGSAVRLMRDSPQMCEAAPGLFEIAGAPTPAAVFAGLLSRQVGASPESIDAEWNAWARAQVGDALGARTPLSDLEVLPDVGPGEIDSFSLSPDGKVILYRTLDPETGVSRLMIAPLDRMNQRTQVTSDNRLGLTSLHALDRRVTALGPDRLVWIGRRGATDVVHVLRYGLGEDGVDLGDATRHSLDGALDLIEAGWPAVDPATGAVLFVALSRASGALDLYRIDDPFDENAPLVRLTDDVYAEQGPVVLGDGSTVVASDATPDMAFELVRLSDGRRELLTDFPGDAGPRSPAPGGSFGVLFHAGTSGRVQAYLMDQGAVIRLTDVPTGFAQPALDARGDLLGIALIDGERRLVRLKRERWLRLASEGVVARDKPAPPWKAPAAELGPEVDYAPLALSNYRLAGLRGSASLAVNAFAQLVFADLFRAHLFALTGFLQTDFDTASFALTYLDRSRRLGLGITAFIENGLQLQPDFRRSEASYRLQRYGGAFQLQYPFGRYTRLEGWVSPQGLRAHGFDLPDTPFAIENAGTNFAVEAVVRLALDAVRLSPLGPVDGLAGSLALSGTVPFGPAQTFGGVTLDVWGYQPLLRGYERLFVYGRLALGTNFGGDFREQYSLPAAYNLRAFTGDSLLQVGDHYVLAQVELHFPISPRVADGLYLQGLAGADAGAVALTRQGLWDDRVFDLVGGVGLGFGGILLRVMVARGIDVGGLDPPDDWVFHLRVDAPFIGLL